jgi:small subunit ribosomal protein S6
MRPYETMIIFDVDAEESAVTAVLDRGVESLKANGGAVDAVNRWGRRPFAYEMHHKREGYYVLLEYTAEPKAVAELDRMLTLADEVMRHKVVRLPDHVAGRSRPASAAAAADAH